MEDVAWKGPLQSPIPNLSEGQSFVQRENVGGVRDDKLGVAAAVGGGARNKHPVADLEAGHALTHLMHITSSVYEDKFEIPT